MTEPKKELIPEAAAVVDRVIAHERWNPVYRRALEDLFKSSAFMCALKEVIVTSDEMLKNAGMTDFTNETSIKAALRTQGAAFGLTQAVELICGLACEPENPATEENKDA